MVLSIRCIVMVGIVCATNNVFSIRRRVQSELRWLGFVYGLSMSCLLLPIGSATLVKITEWSLLKTSQSQAHIHIEWKTLNLSKTCLSTQSMLTLHEIVYRDIHSNTICFRQRIDYAVQMFRLHHKGIWNAQQTQSNYNRLTTCRKRVDSMHHMFTTTPTCVNHTLWTM